jgi:predicted nucleotidyltransferase
MNNFHEQIRILREKKGDPLRIVAAFLNIDQAILSKIERGQRKATREHIVKLAEYFNVKEADLVAAWLSDKIANYLENEDQAVEILKIAEEKVAYKTFKKLDRRVVTKKIYDQLSKSGKIEKAWIYGSFARGDDTPGSDIDIAVQTGKEFSYFDLAEIQHDLEISVNRKIDIGFIDAFKPCILENVKSDLKLVYER